MIVQAILDLDKLGMSLEQWAEFAGDNEWALVKKIAQRSHHMRDMTQGWQRLCTVADWSGETMARKNNWSKPGVYALVVDLDNKNLHPVLSNRTACFGETTQYLFKRVTTHVLALKGKISNMTEKWSKYDSVVDQEFGCNIRQDLNKVWIWTRPHETTDKDYAYDRHHSCLMEKQAIAHYQALWRVTPPANTRDLPEYNMINKAKTLMTENYETIRKFLEE